jgi:Zn-dependent protease/predicted transcriptional regulator
MKWSWRIGQFAGIGVYVHATFLILIGWVGVAQWLDERNVPATISAIAFILALFACVVLHEFGHALTAKKYGIATRDITLLPIGGLARLERMPDDPKQELWVAIAGPAVNVVIAATLYLWIQITGQVSDLGDLTVGEGSFLARLMLVNIFLVLFNMLPAFPMDGGRVLRAFLAMRMDYTRATNIAANVGQAMAFIFGFVGLFSNPFLVFIALFVWMGAQQEASLAGLRSALSGITVSRAMITNYHTLAPRDTLRDAVREILAGSQHDFPVVENGSVIGVVGRKQLVDALARQTLDTPVSEIMVRDFQVVRPSDMLESAFRRLQTCDCHTMPVVENSHLVGMFTMDNIGEFLSIQSALQQRRRGLRPSLLDI